MGGDATLCAPVRAFRDRGALVDLAGLETFVLDSAPGGEAEVTLVLHGFPSSSFDWHLVLGALAARRRVITLDFPGFGLSDKPVDYSYSLHEQADVVEMLLARAGATRVHVVAHDMGTSVACELVARRLRGRLRVELASLALMNGSMHIELAHLTPSQRLLRSPLAPLFAKLASKRVFLLQLRKILARPVADAELDAMWELMIHRGGRDVMPKTISYIDERYRFWHRWIGALRALDLPTLILWGTEDPVAVFAIAERLAGEIPGAKLEALRGVGHYPQLEAPDEVTARLLAFWA